MQKLFKKLFESSKTEKSQPNAQNRYTIEKKIGSGSFGRIYLVYDKKESKK
jgi:hypothetical protein